MTGDTTTITTIDSVLGISSGSTELDLFAKLAIAYILGGFLGMERSYKQKIAGIKTHTLIAVAACLASMAGPVALQAIEGTAGDPSRIAGQILTGIGFVGAGVILHKGLVPVGVTTAASIFFAACIGVSCGLGIPFVAAAATLLILVSTFIIYSLYPEDEDPSTRVLKLIVPAAEYKAIISEFPRDCKFSKVSQDEEGQIEMVVELKNYTREKTDELIESLLKSYSVVSYEAITAVAS